MKPYGLVPPSREPAKPPARTDKPVFVNKKRARQEAKEEVEKLVGSGT